jgi:hypothetical protein
MRVGDVAAQLERRSYDRPANIWTTFYERHWQRPKQKMLLFPMGRSNDCRGCSCPSGFRFLFNHKIPCNYELTWRKGTANL